MSPERLLSKLTSNTTRQLREKMSDYDRIVQNCPFVFMEQNGVVTRVLVGDAITQGIWMDAKKQKSPWNLVRPLYDQEKWQKKAEGYRNDGETLKGGGRIHDHRGLHRSDVKGKGAEAFWRRLFRGLRVR